MSLTMGGGPLAHDAPATVNYRLESPRHALLLHPFPRRVRAELAGRTVLDSLRGALLHETALPPQLYVPAEDIDPGLLSPSDHTTHCPYKGDAAYWHLRVGERVVENAVWAYPEPTAEAAWLRGLSALYWTAADTWYDEDQAVQGHLRDPYHRVDTRPTSAAVRVTYGDLVLAESTAPRLLSETGLPNRHYLPPGDVRREHLVPSQTVTHCPYKGRTVYWNLRVDGREVPDVAWSLPDPLHEALDVRDHLCFLHDDITVEVERR
ncbi:DUF427 domain-containing protein [Streptomonospora nanhaiensis]|uniref:DUF427 domain-containing protein n=1 Tax=Streptomonospora nanhaiensis TaxID=1323731 RepID=UPI001C99FAA3|nr:DUF427 domain-containing protein [Streptomonospora nanhaiensis]MBX9391363.1 DUF427 domain-containing protein [Streptomonospora nanhaiensis]